MDEVPQFSQTAPAACKAGCNLNRFAMGALAKLVIGSALAAMGWVAGIFANGTEVDAQVRPDTKKKYNDVLSDLQLFDGWEEPKPDVVVVLSGEMHGYLQPCGCTSPQFGGLTRRYNLMQMLKQRGWQVVAADLGDIAQTQGPQTLLKYTFAMKALDKMGYSAVSFGEYERRLPLSDAIANYALNYPSPIVLCANLNGRQPGGLFNGTVFDSTLAGKNQGSKVGILALTGPTVEKKVNDAVVQFQQNSQQILTKTLAELKNQGAQLNVLLYEGSFHESQTLAAWWNAQRQNAPGLARIDVILCISRADLPPAMPLVVGQTMVIEVGHKGRHIGVVGAFRNPGANPASPFTLKYQLVSLEPKFETPPGQVMSNPLMQLMEDYAKDVKNGNYLAKYKPTDHPLQLKFPTATYVGSESCQTCHESAFKIWEKSPHSHAFKKLEDAKNPGLRQFDPECVRCHTVGFGYKSGFESLAKTAYLKDVGCESCHGPASEHVAKPRDMAIRAQMNPFKYRGAAPETKDAKNNRLNKIGYFCQVCHDMENDLNFDIDTYWPRIEHMLSPEKK